MKTARHSLRLQFAALMVAVQFVGCGARQTPEDLFREAVCNPIPASVQVIKATRKSRLGNIEVWLHFKASKQDMGTVLKAERYQDLGSSKLNYSAYGPPAWWTPDVLGEVRRCLDCETPPHFGRDRSAKDIVLNEANNGAFFLLRSWYNY
jgi:hypothetical protein